MNRDSHGLLPAAIVVTIAAAVPANASVYLTADAAMRRLFPAADAWEGTPVVLNDAQRADVAKRAGSQAAHGQLRAWTARAQGKVIGHVFIDEVVGRQDFITYAVGVDASGKLTPVEILEYRESHGGEIRNDRWLAQFSGRASVDSLRFRTDVKNIAGATLSSEHVTAGVRRILALWQSAFADAANNPSR